MLCSSLIEVLIWWIGCFLFVLNKILESHCLPKFYFDCLLVALSSSKWIIQWFLFDLYIFSSIDITKLCLPVSLGPWHDAQRCVELLNIDDVTFYALFLQEQKHSEVNSLILSTCYLIKYIFWVWKLRWMSYESI